ncbi:MAG: hypothetical protein ACR2FO_03495, partial [Actinomycetota bacterium]
MTVFLLAMLAGMWGVVFLPMLIRARQQSSPVSSVTTFNKGLQALNSGHVTSAGRWVVMPSAPRQESAGNFAIARRKKVFTGLLVFCGSTLALGLMPGLHWLLWLNVIGDLVLAVMVSFLVSLQAAKRESRQYTPRRVA